MTKLYACMMIFMVLLNGTHGAEKITNSRISRPEGSGYVVLGGDVSLPAQGVWQLGAQDEQSNDVRYYMVPPQSAVVQVTGVRMAKVQRTENIARGRYHVRMHHSPSMDYARTHDGVGAATVSDFDEKKYSYAIKSLDRSPWHQSEYKDLEGPFAFMLPSVKFDFEGEENRRRVPRAKRAVLAVELRPFVDDDMHWVTYTDGSTERKLIDSELVKKHALVIRPVLPKEAPVSAKPPVAYTYKVMAVCSGELAGKLKINFYNPITCKNMTAEWRISSVKEEDVALQKQMQKARRREWAPYLQMQASGVLPVWVTGLKMSNSQADSRGRRDRGRTTSAMNVLGGRAAMQETLQMQVLTTGDKQKEWTIPIETLDGVKVKSHPYKEMLKGKAGGKLSIASYAPADHFFLYLAKPKMMLPMLDDGAGFMSNLGGSFTGNNIKYYLKARYLARLGLSEKWLQMFLNTGAVEECCFLAPDLFFIDGTDLTVVSRLSNSKLITPLLKMAGASGLSEGSVIKAKGKSNESTFWVLEKGLLIISTSRSEVSLVQNLIKNKGKGSLGESSEFKYMLTKLPLKNNSRALAYFSDSFIRKLVGPAMKIAQLRRVKEKGRLEFITARALLAQLDGVKESSSIETLVKHGYLPKEFIGSDYSLGSDLVASSSEYGTLRNMVTLSMKPVTKISTDEAAAYKRYMTNYTRFWRQFFDPIAMRLDDTADKSLELTTFILPLIDSSIYNGLKEFVVSHEDGVVMKTPRFATEPVMKLSVNLKDEAWESVTSDMGEFIMEYIGVNAAVTDDLGPAVHLAIHDADPVIALGSGDIMGAFGGDMRRLGGGSEMMAIPLMMSMLTRPCTLAVATKDSERTLRHLRMAATMHRALQRDDDLNVNLYQIKGKDSWVYSMDVMGLIKIRLGLEVRDGFVFIKNIPWSKKNDVVGVEDVSLNGLRLAVYPAACKMQLPGLHAAASEHQASSSYAGASMLYPLLASGYSNLEDSQSAHMKLFGCHPVHPAGGEWEWVNRNIRSTTYGTLDRMEQPVYKNGDEDFGVMKKIKNLTIETQFEESGLRTKVKWKVRPTKTSMSK